jgi:hypothetical protein
MLTEVGRLTVEQVVLLTALISALGYLIVEIAYKGK